MGGTLAKQKGQNPTYMPPDFAFDYFVALTEGPVVSRTAPIPAKNFKYFLQGHVPCKKYRLFCKCAAYGGARGKTAGEKGQNSNFGPFLRTFPLAEKANGLFRQPRAIEDRAGRGGANPASEFAAFGGKGTIAGSATTTRRRDDSKIVVDIFPDLYYNKSYVRCDVSPSRASRGDSGAL